MVGNHPNRRRTPFVVHMIGERVARFTNSEDAQEWGQVYSERHRVFVEVSAPDGLIGQYKHGVPTEEFACRGDNWFPPGPKKA